MEWTYIDDVLVDATETESPTFSNEITDKPLEDGNSIQDHINNNPNELSLDITITGEYGGTPQEKYERLLEIRDEREIISIVGAMQVYENMAISEMSLEKTAENQTGYSGSVSFQQIKYAKAETVETEVKPPVIDGEEQPAPGEDSDDTSKKDSKTENVDEDTVNNKSLGTKLTELGGDG